MSVILATTFLRSCTEIRTHLHSHKYHQINIYRLLAYLRIIINFRDNLNKKPNNNFDFKAISFKQNLADHLISHSLFDPPSYPAHASTSFPEHPCNIYSEGSFRRVPESGSRGFPSPRPRRCAGAAQREFDPGAGIPPLQGCDPAHGRIPRIFHG